MASFGGNTTSGNVAVSPGGPGDHAACDAEMARLRSRLAEVRQAVDTFLAVRGDSLGAGDLAEAIRQVLDREPS